jgi:hypothetical protein
MNKAGNKILILLPANRRHYYLWIIVFIALKIKLTPLRH